MFCVELINQSHREIHPSLSASSPPTARQLFCIIYLIIKKNTIRLNNNHKNHKKYKLNNFLEILYNIIEYSYYNSYFFVEDFLKHQQEPPPAASSCQPSLASQQASKLASQQAQAKHPPASQPTSKLCKRASARKLRKLSRYYQYSRAGESCYYMIQPAHQQSQLYY